MQLPNQKQFMSMKRRRSLTEAVHRQRRDLPVLLLLLLLVQQPPPSSQRYQLTCSNYIRHLFLSILL